MTEIANASDEAVLAEMNETVPEEATKASAGLSEPFEKPLSMGIPALTTAPDPVGDAEKAKQAGDTDESKKDLPTMMAECEAWITDVAPIGFKAYFPKDSPYKATKEGAKRFSELTEDEYAAQTAKAHYLRLCDVKNMNIRLFSCDKMISFPRDTVSMEDVIECLNKCGYVQYGDDGYKSSRMYPQPNTRFRHPDFMDDPDDFYGWSKKRAEATDLKAKLDEEGDGDAEPASDQTTGLEEKEAGSSA